MKITIRKLKELIREGVMTSHGRSRAGGGLTSQEIMDLAGTPEEPIWTKADVSNLAREHGAYAAEFFDEHPGEETFRASDVLGWLGY